tara:strand:- start:266 stop:1630 length:1365 start_codon:yes stop_codon:yes gene_type:complete
MKHWTKSSWKKYSTHQQPEWPDENKYKKIINEISTYPPLIFDKEAELLKKYLADASEGKNFVIQGGDCAETFIDFNSKSIHDKLKILLQMSVIIAHGASSNVIRIGRIAGQFAKPRSSKSEMRGNTSLPSYRGDAINDIAYDETSRTPNPDRIIKAYHQSAATLNLLRAFTNGGFTDLSKIKEWNENFINNSNTEEKYDEIVKKINESVKFFETIGGYNSNQNMPFKMAEFFTSHEALLLDYESALTHKNNITNKWYCCSAHFLWVGNRTRNIDGSHIEFLRGIGNPIGIKISSSMKTEELLNICNKLNPQNEKGKLTLISRMGSKKINTYLPSLINAIQKEGINVLWMCDPMHGNTYKLKSGYKTRDFDTIMNELESFFSIHHNLGTIPGGIHLEFTGEHVTECLGGTDNIIDNDLRTQYATACDPRLNINQSLELAYRITKLLIKNKENNNV